MASVNKTILVGNCGKDPELKYMPSGSAVASLSLATTEKWKDKASGEKKEQTTWHNLVFFGRIAEIVSEYAKKGSSIYVEGQIRNRSYEKDGQTRYISEVVVREMQLLGGKQSEAPGGAGRPQPVAQRPSAITDGFDDDIPF